MSNLTDFPRYLFDQRKSFREDVPSIIKSQAFIDNLINFLFPIKADRTCECQQITLNLQQLQIDLKNILHLIEDSLEQDVNTITNNFFEEIPAIYKSLINDAKAFIDFDPAAKSMESVIAYYPGYYAISVYRLANVLYKLNVPFVPRIISEHAHSKTGIDLHPGATIGEHFLIDHGTGIVIGETCVIGNNVKIYQGVTLGALYVTKGLSGKKRHPTIQDNVIIYGGSTILGGNTVIGKNTIVGGNVWITKSVPVNSIVYHESKTRVRDSNEKWEPDYII
ncbi:serine O-acetyltransferase [Bacteroidales bacterium]|nr:serine O-acetyltransferase [Bacteroidales bacterium]